MRRAWCPRILADRRGPLVFQWPLSARRGPIDEQLFWRLVDTAAGSAAERELRNQIYDRYAWVPARFPRRWIPRWALLLAARDDYEQIAGAALMTAIVNHVPTSPFVAHAFGSCRGAIRGAIADALFERLPNVDAGDRRLVTAVAAHLGRVDPNGFIFDRAYFVSALNRAEGIAAELGQTPADVRSPCSC